MSSSKHWCVPIRYSFDVNRHCVLQLKRERSRTLMSQSRNVPHSTRQNSPNLSTLRAKMPKIPAFYMSKCLIIAHSEKSCTPHVKIPKNYALYVPKCRNILHSTCQKSPNLSTSLAKMPKIPAFHMSKCLTITHSETSCTPHVKILKNYALYVSKRRNVPLYMPQRETHLSSNREFHLPYIYNNNSSPTENTEFPQQRALC